MRLFVLNCNPYFAINAVINPSEPLKAPARLHLLLAEVERSVAFSVSFALKADGYIVEIVSDGGAALAELTAKPAAFDLLITDHSMPRGLCAKRVAEFTQPHCPSRTKRDYWTEPQLRSAA
jgi:hypothetical protein